MSELTRCPWPDGDAKMIKYHDEVWGVPVHDYRKLFAKLAPCHSASGTNQ